MERAIEVKQELSSMALRFDQFAEELERLDSYKREPDS